VSSCRSDPVALGTVLLSDRPCGCLLGGGAGFLVGCEVVTGGFGVVCGTFGGVGGRGGMMMLSPGCISGSGTLPAASRSNTLSVSSSAGDFFGAGGSGLLKSDGGEDICLGGDARGIEALYVRPDDGEVG
jgi:hypothetical protein